MNINDLKNKLDSYENQINESEKKKANIEGKQESLLEKLKTELQINNIDEIDEIDEIDKFIEANEGKKNEIEKDIRYYLLELEKYDMEGNNET